MVAETMQSPVLSTQTGNTILLFILPFVAVRLALQPVFPLQHGGTAFMLFIGMRYLDRDSVALRYGQAAILPFFVVHQPVVLAIAYFVVQWNTGLLPKMLAVAAGSLVATLAIYKLVIRRIGPLRALFGMKSRRLQAQAVAVSS